MSITRSPDTVDEEPPHRNKNKYFADSVTGEMDFPSDTCDNSGQRILEAIYNSCIQVSYRGNCHPDRVTGLLYYSYTMNKSMNPCMNPKEARVHI